MTRGVGPQGQEGIVEFREYLKRKCREQNISLHRLAVRCDLNQIYFYQAINKNKENPPPWVLRRAAPHLGVSFVELMIAAGHLTEDDLREHTLRSQQRKHAPERERVPV
ncbi:MAG: hypothetical protein E6J00_01255 [Chloroflexi bacterium]|nr:MAG: hypothetical protein E6J00_01255 [Chloroflexota bacterium]